MRIHHRALGLLKRTAIHALFPSAHKTRTIRLGSGFGAWIIPTDLMSPKSICYSAGVGEDLSFDLDLIQKYGCQVVALDPTPRAIEFATAAAARHPRFNFLPVGLWSRTGDLRFFAPSNPAHVSHSILNLQRTDEFITAPCRRLGELMAELGHSKIDLLKLDIEGAEYEVLTTMLEDHLDVTAICVEFDQPMPLVKTYQMLRTLRESGYEVVAKDRWDFTLLKRSETHLSG